MEENNRITLVMVCDNHLVVMLGVLLKSIERSYFGRHFVDIYIVNDGIRKTNVDKINQIILHDKINIIWLTMEEAVPEKISLPLDKTTFPVCAYVRICIPHFLSKSIKRAIYLDVDMMLLKNIEELWNIQLEDHVIGAVLDRSETVSSTWGGIRNYKELGLDPESKYFNSGLLVIDLEKWRKINATELVIDAINENIDFVTFADQYGLNIVFANQWFEVDRKWNCYAQNLDEDPSLVHFTGMKPIFKGYSYNKKYRTIFYEILNLTPWSGFKPKNDYNRFIKKLWNVITKKVQSSF